MKKLTSTTYSHKGYHLERIFTYEAHTYLYHISKDGETVDAADTLEAARQLINGFEGPQEEEAPQQHSAKRIEAGEYEYRGCTIERDLGVTAGNYGAWFFRINGKAAQASTLRQAKVEIDATKDHDGDTVKAAQAKAAPRQARMEKELVAQELEQREMVQQQQAVELEAAPRQTRPIAASTKQPTNQPRAIDPSTDIMVRRPQAAAVTTPRRQVDSFLGSAAHHS